MNTAVEAFRLLGRERRGRWAALVAVAVVSSGVEIIGAALVYVLLGLVADPSGAVDLPVVGDVRALVGVDGDGLLLGLAAAMAVFFLVRAVIHIGEIYLQQRVGHTAGAHLSARLAEGYLRMPYAFHLERTSADLIRNSHQAIRELVVSVYIPMIRVVAESIMVVGMLALLVVLAPAATGLAVLVVGSAALLLLRVIQPRLKRYGRRAHALDKETLGLLQQSLHGVRDIKVLAKERYFGRRYAGARLGWARMTYLRSAAADLPKTVMELALLGFILIVFAGAVATGSTGQETLSVLGLFAYAGLRLQPSLQRIISGLNNLKYASAPIADLSRDLTLMEAAETSSPPEHTSLPLSLERSWRAEGVSFRYGGAHRESLTDVDLTIAPGQVVGICGPTGSGKTTLVDILVGLLTPTAGKVTVDDRDLRDDVRGWQRNLGIVSQMVFLIEGTLRENIALGVAAEDVAEDALREAIDLAQLSSHIAELPDGVDTVVGERGVRLSGGQRQRVAIARALYRRPQVLVFDEGTSALDNATERELMSALSRLRGDHTIVLIAHRLSTVREADVIVFLEGGAITGAGRYDDLIASHAAFRALAAIT